MKYLFLFEEDAPSQRDLPSDRFDEDDLAAVDNEALTIIRFNTSNSCFERLEVESDTTTEDDDDGEGEETTSYEVGEWIKV